MNTTNRTVEEFETSLAKIADKAIRQALDRIQDKHRELQRTTAGRYCNQYAKELLSGVRRC